jgi:hypothetical protein
MKKTIFQVLIGALIFIGTTSMAECSPKNSALNAYVKNSELQAVYDAYTANNCTITKDWHLGGEIPGYIIKTYYDNNLYKAKNNVKHITVELTKLNSTCHIFKEVNGRNYYITTCD